MHALVRFANIAAGQGFHSVDIHPAALESLGAKESEYKLSSFRYDLSKLRAKGLVEKIHPSFPPLPAGWQGLFGVPQSFSSCSSGSMHR